LGLKGNNQYDRLHAYEIFIVHGHQHWLLPHQLGAYIHALAINHAHGATVITVGHAANVVKHISSP
jgi:hypothetical protein